jgi:hypothetical protein
MVASFVVDWIASLQVKSVGFAWNFSGEEKEQA